MNNIEIARQTLHIIEYRQYEVSGKIIHLPDYDYEDVVLYSPEDVAKLLESNIEDSYELCKLTITTELCYIW